MREIAMSRRTMLGGAGTGMLAAVAIAPKFAGAAAGAAMSPQREETVRSYYKGWEKKDWHSMNALLTDNFTFTSPVDDHISKSAFKTGCWDTQAALIERFDLKQVSGTGNDAFVLYIGHTTSGKTFRNVEYVRLRGGQVEAVECYFGAQNSYPSEVNKQK